MDFNQIKQQTAELLYDIRTDGLSSWGQAAPCVSFVHIGFLSHVPACFPHQNMMCIDYYVSGRQRRTGEEEEEEGKMNTG